MFEVKIKELTHPLLPCTSANLSEDVSATNEAGVEAPAVQFQGEGMESVK